MKKVITKLIPRGWRRNSFIALIAAVSIALVGTSIASAYGYHHPAQKRSSAAHYSGASINHGKAWAGHTGKSTHHPSTPTPTPTPPVVVPTTPTTPPAKPVQPVPPATGSGSGSGVTTPTGWPNAQTTGVPAGTVLKNSGALDISTPGTVIDGFSINGDVHVHATNVTIKNSKVTGKIQVDQGSTGTLIQRVEIAGPGVSSPDTDRPGIASYDFTCDGCNIHGWGKGAYLDENAVVKNSWIHDEPVYGDPANGGSHNEPILSIGGKNLTIVGNRLDAGTESNFSAALALYSQGSQTVNALVQGNLLNGGGYCLYAGSDANIMASNVRIVGNTFGNSMYTNCGYYGAGVAFFNGNGNTWNGNIWQNGSAVPMP